MCVLKAMCSGGLQMLRDDSWCYAHHPVVRFLYMSQSCGHLLPFVAFTFFVHTTKLCTLSGSYLFPSLTGAVRMVGCN